MTAKESIIEQIKLQLNLLNGYIELSKRSGKISKTTLGKKKKELIWPAFEYSHGGVNFKAKEMRYASVEAIPIIEDPSKVQRSHLYTFDTVYSTHPNNPYGIYEMTSLGFALTNRQNQGGKKYHSDGWQLIKDMEITIIDRHTGAPVDIEEMVRKEKEYFSRYKV